MQHARLHFQREGVDAEIQLTAYTGVAAFNIGFGARTACGAFQIFPNAAWKEELEGERYKKLEALWGHVVLLIVDEVSFIGRAFFARMHWRLQQANLAMRGLSGPADRLARPASVKDLATRAQAEVPPNVRVAGFPREPLEDADGGVFILCPRAPERDACELLVNTASESLVPVAILNPYLVDMGTTGFGMAGRMFKERFSDTRRPAPGSVRSALGGLAMRRAAGEARRPQVRALLLPADARVGRASPDLPAALQRLAPVRP